MPQMPFPRRLRTEGLYLLHRPRTCLGCRDLAPQQNEAMGLPLVQRDYVWTSNERIKSLWHDVVDHAELRWQAPIPITDKHRMRLKAHRTHSFKKQ